MSGSQPGQGESNRRLLLRLSVIAVAMFGFGYALVPFYYAICQALLSLPMMLERTGGSSSGDNCRIIE